MKGIAPSYGTFLLLNGILGAGLLNLPYAFAATGGLVTALLTEMVTAVFVLGSLFMVAAVVNHRRCHSYVDMVEFTMGKVARLLTEFVVAVACLGSCSIYIVITGNQAATGIALLLSAITTTTTTTAVWYEDARFWMCVSSALLLLPFLFPRQLGAIAKASVIGVPASLYLVFSVAVPYIYRQFTPNSEPLLPPSLPPISAAGILRSISTFAFSFQNHTGAVVVLSQLSKRRLHVYLLILAISTAAAALLYGAMGTYGVLLFGRTVHPDILLNYSPKNIPIGIGRLMVILLLMVSYALVAYVGRTSCHNLLQGAMHGIDKAIISSAMQVSVPQWYTSAVLWLAASLTIAVFVPNIGHLISYLGAVSAYIMFVCPAFAFAALDVWDSRPQKLRAAVYAACAVYAAVGGFIMASSVAIQAMAGPDH